MAKMLKHLPSFHFKWTSNSQWIRADYVQHYPLCQLSPLEFDVKGKKYLFIPHWMPNAFSTDTFPSFLRNGNR